MNPIPRDCRDLLTSIVRAQRQAAKLEGMRRRVGGGLQGLGEELGEE